MTLSQSYTVYAIDLLGFGASDKPVGFAYTMEAWAQVYLSHAVVNYLLILNGSCMGNQSFKVDILSTDPVTHCKQLILDFLDEVIQKPTVLIGNSVGSLACVIAASGMF